LGPFPLQDAADICAAQTIVLSEVRSVTRQSTGAWKRILVTTRSVWGPDPIGRVMQVGAGYRAAEEAACNNLASVGKLMFLGCTVVSKRQKTGLAVAMAIATELRQALDAAQREHVTILNTEFGVNGFSGFKRDAIRAAGLPLDCRPHGLRKTLGRRLADAGVSAHDIMAALGYTTLAQAKNYTREADRRKGGRRAVLQLNDHKANTSSQTATERLGRLLRRR